MNHEDCLKYLYRPGIYLFLGPSNDGTSAADGSTAAADGSTAAADGSTAAECTAAADFDGTLLGADLGTAPGILLGIHLELSRRYAFIS